MNDLTLPGTIPGLLLECSPARTLRGDAVVQGLEDRRFDGEEPVRGAVVSYRSLGYIEWLPLTKVDLLLESATGRAHAAWRLAERLGKPRDATWARSWPASDARTWVLSAPGRGNSISDWSVTFVHDPEAGLMLPDANDSRLLPDGSRLVDALALKLVCLHVAGLTK